MREAYFFSLIFNAISKPLNCLCYCSHILLNFFTYQPFLPNHLEEVHFKSADTWVIFIVMVFSWSSLHCQRRLCVYQLFVYVGVCMCVCVCERERINTRMTASYKYWKGKKTLFLWNCSHLSSLPFYPSSFIFLSPKCNASIF